jgi:hypothetical protein
MVELLRVLPGRGVSTVILSFVSRSSPWRRLSALAAVAVATMAYGCGSSTDTGRGAAPKDGTDLADQLKEEDLYRYVGTGAAKHKESISRRERVKLLHEAAKKASN